MNNFSSSKRALFRRLSNQSAEVLRPPWAIDEYEFVNTCTACGACRLACETNIIKLDKRNQPCVDFNEGECTFCKNCVEACENEALFYTDTPWSTATTVNSSCLAHNHVHCQSCSDHCEQQAIHFAISTHGISKPKINSQSCNGCGACISICPQQSIEI